jgi:ferric-dicitrate binding protein FerR (iron transport regulator)
MKVGTQQISAYFDGDLSSAEQQSLCAWLLQNRSHVDEFVRCGFVHTQLIEMLSANQLHANALVAAEGLSPTATQSPTKPKRSQLWITNLTLLAASIGVVLTLGCFLAWRHTVVATISRTQNVQWVDDTAASRNVGSLVQAGDDIALKSGTLFLTFARGGQIALEGPCRFHVDSDNGGQLRGGRLWTFVPEHAVGFKVQCGRLAIVDLGTEFQVEMQDDESSLVQVFDGLVELQYAEQDNTERHAQISQGRAIQFDAKRRAISSIDYQSARQLPKSAWSK